MYFHKTCNPRSSNSTPNMKSGASQVPFFFGGSQVPTDLFLPKTSYSGSSGSGLTNKTHVPKTHPTSIDIKGDEVYNRKNDNIKIPYVLPFY